MTDNEIIKALEEYRNSKIVQSDNGVISIGNILDLINRQQAENKELKTENLILSQKRFNIFERIEFTDKLKKQIKSEAIKEFAERLKKEYTETFLVSGDTVIEILDNLVKEMVGDAE